MERDSKHMTLTSHRKHEVGDVIRLSSMDVHKWRVVARQSATEEGKYKYRLERAR